MSFQEERRDAKSQRIAFDAIVELGGDVDPTSAFEAQGVDVSATGMHLRTAYLPDIGQPLLCRFGSGAQEIAAEADVVWRREGARGGEFGIRFTNLDGASAAALWEMCGMNRGESAEGQRESRPDADPGTRVRLHIDGLGSPMKARVRGSTDEALLVGSNLEFLRVGRTLELEDVDHGGKRPAHIDRVDVEVDHATRVPQLVVTLRYDDVPEAEPVRTTAERLAAIAAPMPEHQAASEPSDSAPPVTVSEAAAPASLDSSDEIEAAKMMRSKFANAAADVMPKVAELGLRAKTTMGVLLAKAFERKGEATRRRTTSPPPTGALHASGKRVVRDGDDDDFDARAEIPKRKIGKRGMMIVGGSAGLLTVLTAMALHKPQSPPPGARTTATDLAPTAAAPSPSLGGIDPATGAEGALQANVPLFGATTLSTTEPVTPAPPGAAIIPGSAGQGFASQGASAAAPMEAVDDRKSDSDADDDKSHAKVTPFGHGKVSHAIVLRMKTDGDISAIHGARTPTGFSVTLPGRRSTGSGSALASRDSRIASLKVSNGSKGSELTFEFKDGVPPYLVRAKGHDLQVALGRIEALDDGPKDDTKHGPTAKKRSTETHHRSKKD